MGVAQEVPLGLAQVIAVLAGFVIPLVVEFVVRYNAPLWVKSAVSAASAGLTAVALWLTQTEGAHTWVGLVTAFVAAVIAAGSSKSALTGGVITHKIARKTATFGIGAPKLDAASARVVKESAKRHP